MDLPNDPSKNPSFSVAFYNQVPEIPHAKFLQSKSLAAGRVTQSENGLHLKWPGKMGKLT